MLYIMNWTHGDLPRRKPSGLAWRSNARDKQRNARLEPRQSRFLSTCLHSSSYRSLVGLSAACLPCLYGAEFVCCVVSRLSCLVMSLLPGKDYEEGVEKGARGFAGINGKMTRSTKKELTLTDLRFARPNGGNSLRIRCLPRRQRQQAKQQ